MNSPLQFTGPQNGVWILRSNLQARKTEYEFSAPIYRPAKRGIKTFLNFQARKTGYKNFFEFSGSQNGVWIFRSNLQARKTEYEFSAPIYRPAKLSMNSPLQFTGQQNGV